MARSGRPALDTMPLKKLSVELREAMMDELDEYVSRRQRAHPRAHLKRSDVVRDLIERALKTATEEIEAYMTRRQEEHPAATLSRADILRELVDVALHTALPQTRRAGKKGAIDAA